MRSVEKGLEGESFVNKIAFSSFMKYWCYPNPRDEYGDKKEICDLLMIFDNSVLIVSVKNYEFKDNYDRYFRTTIDKAVKQIYGAERKLFQLKRDVYIKHPNKNIERFPRENINRVFRIIINLGDGVRFYPFNKQTKNEKYVCLFDKNSFENVVNELDTFPDFIEYLAKREDLFNNKNVIILPGEESDFPVDTAKQFFEYSREQINMVEKNTIFLSGTENDLLAHYFRNTRNFPESIDFENYDHAFLQIDGAWEEFVNEGQVIRGKQLDKYSYFIDELVKNEILIKSGKEHEELAIELLSFNRFFRRMIAKKFLDFCDLYKKNKGLEFARRYFDLDDKGIVFTYYTPEMSPQIVDVLIEIAIESFCLYTNYKNKDIIMISTTRNFQQFKMGLIKNIEPFPEEKEKQIRMEVEKLGWFTKHQRFEGTEYEFPVED